MCGGYEDKCEVVEEKDVFRGIEFSGDKEFAGIVKLGKERKLASRLIGEQRNETEKEAKSASDCVLFE